MSSRLWPVTKPIIFESADRVSLATNTVQPIISTMADIAPRLILAARLTLISMVFKVNNGILKLYTGVELNNELREILDSRMFSNIDVSGPIPDLGYCEYVAPAGLGLEIPSQRILYGSYTNGDANHYLSWQITWCYK